MPDNAVTKLEGAHKSQQMTETESGDCGDVDGTVWLGIRMWIVPRSVGAQTHFLPWNGIPTSPANLRS